MQFCAAWSGAGVHRSSGAETRRLRMTVESGSHTMNSAERLPASLRNCDDNFPARVFLLQVGNRLGNLG